jgi:transposase-like protein
MGMVERNGRVVAGVVPDTRRDTLQSKIYKHVEPGSAVITDALNAYNGLNSHFAHEAIDHAVCFGKGQLHTNSIESFWALFKRGYHGIYHQMSRKHMQRYLEEYSFRFNRRTQRMQCVWSDVVASITETTQLPYKELIA